MRLLKYDDRGELCLTRDLSIKDAPDYAILSHTWGDEWDEMSFQELETGPDKSKFGYRKLQLCGEQAKRDGLEYFWVDTCCINKAHGPELSENINLMFRYYQEAKKCYAFLHDVKNEHSDTDFVGSRWFTRGWTLQELLAPHSVDFYSDSWDHLGTRSNLKQTIHEITRIPLDALCGRDLSQFSKQERMSWISGRQTKKEEDRAYALLGIFGVSLIVNYGEGETEAFIRLEDQIKKKIKPTIQDLDDHIRRYYLSQGRLDIELLSGQHLPMDTCYINLAIVGQYSGRDSGGSGIDREANNSHLASRINVGIAEQSKAVSLEALFTPRKLAHGSTDRPKRLVIWGRAGMGKTTLCKKIVYEFLNHALWTELYDRIFWLPLRRLGLMQSEAKRDAELIREICFHAANDGLIPVDALDDILQASSDRCLFLLDGLDEVSNIDYDSPLGANLCKLLRKENVIITSRPHISSILKQVQLDLEFEAVGFSADQVEDFLQKEPEQANIPALRSFIDKRPTVQTLVRIPIQLDAICYAWREGNIQQDAISMTALYQAIVTHLWRKDIVRLGKKVDGERVSPQQARTSENIECFIGQERSCLEKLAFAALFSEIAEFTASSFGAVVGGREPLLDSRLRTLSFIRSSGNSSDSADHSYHFIHLTFQDFFAARYFIRHWISSEAMLFPNISHKHVRRPLREESIVPMKFLQISKYNTRYNIFWRFVTGLLQAEYGNESLDRFFGQIETEPHDLLGSVHQMLIVHCLHEVSTDLGNFASHAQRLELEFFNWTIFESELCRTRQLLELAECPDSIIKRWLERPAAAQRPVMDMLCGRSNISTELLSAVVDVVMTYWKFTGYPPIFEALAVIMFNCDNLTQEVFSKVFQSQSIHLWWTAGQIYSDNRLSGNRLMRIVMLYFGDQDFDVSCRAAEILWACVLTESVYESLESYLQSPIPNIQKAAVYSLQRGSPQSKKNMPESTSRILINLLSQQDFDVADRAACVLGENGNLPICVVDAISQLLTNRQLCIRIRAARALSHNRNLSALVVEHLVRCLQDTSPELRYEAACALAEHPGLPQPVIELMLRQFRERGEHNCRSRNIYGGGERAATGPDYAVRELQYKAALEDLANADLEARRSALMACSTYDPWLPRPNFVTEAIIQFLDDRDSTVRHAAIEQLRPGILPLPMRVVDPLIRVLRDESSDARRSAAYVLSRRCPTISEQQLNSVVQLLRTESTAWAAMIALEGRTEFYEKFISLDSISLTNLLRRWLHENFERRTPSYLMIHDDILVIEVNGKCWNVSIKKEEHEIFERRWLKAQQALGVPELSRLTRPRHSIWSLRKYLQS